MGEPSFDVVNGVDWLLRGVVVVILLVIVVKIDEIGVVIVASLPLWAVAGEVSLLAALETSVVSRVTRWSLSVSDVSSSCIAASPAPPIVRGAGSIEVHWDRLVVHPSRCVGGVVLGSLLSLSSSLAKSLVTVPSSSSVLREEWPIRHVSSRKCRKVRRRVSSTSSVLRRIVASLRREDGVQ